MLLDLAAQRSVLFFGGKGGVGKTSVASATALTQAYAGRRVLIVSTDPAHNLGHLWQTQIHDVVTDLAEFDGGGSLQGVEVDPAAATAAHLEEVGESLRTFMPQHLHSQVDAHLRLAVDSPGTHESAILERIASIIENRAAYDLIVVDTAPSGHTARLLALPEIMTAWTEGLLQRRSKAEKFGAAIRALDGDDDPEAVSSPQQRDRRIRQILTARRTRFEQLRELLTDASRCSFAIVLTAERLPVLESAELHAELTRLGVDVGGLVVNRLSPRDEGDFLAARRAQEENHLQELRHRLPEVAIDTLPMLAGDLMGHQAVDQLAAQLR